LPSWIALLFVAVVFDLLFIVPYINTLLPSSHIVFSLLPWIVVIGFVHVCLCCSVTVTRFTVVTLKPRWPTTYFVLPSVTLAFATFACCPFVVRVNVSFVPRCLHAFCSRLILFPLIPVCYVCRLTLLFVALLLLSLRCCLLYVAFCSLYCWCGSVALILRSGPSDSMVVFILFIGFCMVLFL